LLRNSFTLSRNFTKELTDMVLLGGLIAIHLVALTIYMLLKKYNASITLLIMGMAMTLIAFLLNINGLVNTNVDFILFTLFDNIVNAFSERISGVGLMVMLLCGYVEYMKRIKASDVFVYVMMQPLSVFKKYPYLATILIIPIGQILSLAIPSAAGVALLLVATIYPLLLGLGMNKMTALTAIVACTLLDFGVNSPCSIMAAEVLGMDIVTYFSYQIKIVIPMCIVIMVVYLVYYIWIDKYHKPNRIPKEKTAEISEWRNIVPLYYAVLPALPLLLSIIFSRFLPLSDKGYYLDLNASILLSFFIAGIADIFRRRSVKDAFSSMTIFWQGMGKIFATVVVLIVAADIFAEGLRSIGFIDSMISVAQSLNLGKTGITIMLSLMAFFSTAITGSGIASFDAYRQIVPDVAMQFGMDPLSLMMPIQMISGIGRAITPIAIVMIVLSEVGGVSPFKLAKHNLIPIAAIVIILLLYTLNINY